MSAEEAARAIDDSDDESSVSDIFDLDEEARIASRPLYARDVVETVPQDAPLFLLPDEILLSILALTPLSERITILHVCRHWRRVGIDYSLWARRTLCFAETVVVANASRDAAGRCTLRTLNCAVRQTDLEKLHRRLLPSDPNLDPSVLDDSVTTVSLHDLTNRSYLSWVRQWLSGRTLQMLHLEGEFFDPHVFITTLLECCPRLQMIHVERTAAQKCDHLLNATLPCASLLGIKFNADKYHYLPLSELPRDTKLQRVHLGKGRPTLWGANPNPANDPTGVFNRVRCPALKAVKARRWSEEALFGGAPPEDLISLTVCLLPERGMIDVYPTLERLVVHDMCLLERRIQRFGDACPFPASHVPSLRRLEYFGVDTAKRNSNPPQLPPLAWFKGVIDALPQLALVRVHFRKHPRLKPRELAERAKGLFENAFDIGLRRKTDKIAYLQLKRKKV